MSYLLRTLFYSNTKKLINGCESFNRNSFSNVLVRKDFEVRNLYFRRKLYFKQREKKYWFSKRSIFTRWTPIGLVSYGVFAYNRGVNEKITQVELTCYCHLPFRIISKIFGNLAHKQIPLDWRESIYGAYVRVFDVNMEEAEETDLKKYPSLNDFFTRNLKEDVRPVDQNAVMVSPCDGRIMSVGPIIDGQVKDVKGVTYSLQNFIGRNSWNDKDYTDETDEELIRKYFPTKTVYTQKSKEGQKEKKVKDKVIVSDEDFHQSLLVNPDTHRLHQCVIYLAPGDYHRFHAPCEWLVRFRRHFSAKLLSVNPAWARIIPGLLSMNERVVYVGLWGHGFFCYSPVGATNVGSIKIYKDDALHTNGRKKKRCSESLMEPPFSFEKGEMVGQFNMGSTIVLIFEAPKNFQFCLQEGSIVKTGQKIGHFVKSATAAS